MMIPRVLTSIAALIMFITMMLLSLAPTFAADDNIGLSYEGNGSVTSTDPFFGNHTVVPGSTLTRTVDISNNGPTDALLTVRIINVQLDNPDSGSTTIKDWLDLSSTFGSTHASYPLAHVLDTDNGVLVDQQRIGAAHTEDLTLTLGWDPTSTEGNQVDFGSSTITFDVEYTLAGLPETSTPTPSPEPTTPIIRTGGSLAVYYLVGALTLIGVGLVVLATRRSSRDEAN